MLGSSSGLLCGLFIAAAGPSHVARPAAKEVVQLGQAVRAYRAGAYEAAAKLLQGLPERTPRTRDVALYLLGESEFFAGRPQRALGYFKELERDTGSRFAQVASYRAADCAWSSGARAEAVATYRRLLGASAEGERPTPKLDRARENVFIAGGGLQPDPVVGRFRIALLLGEATTADGQPDGRARSRAARAFRALNLEFPAHPLADDAAQRAEALEPPSGPPSKTAPPRSEAEVTAKDRIARAQALAEARRFEAAVAELESLPPTLPPELEAQRAYQLGMTKFRMRNDYAGAAEQLLGAEGKLTGDKAAHAAFMGTRALARADRDDEAIAGYRRFLERYGETRHAAEASFLIGWLDFNRSRFREALPAFEETVRRFPRTSMATSATWFIAFSHILLGDGAAALAALESYARLSPNVANADNADKADKADRTDKPDEAAARFSYFRARALLLAGLRSEGKAALQGVAQRAPFSYYGLLARARLRAIGAPPPLKLPPWTQPPPKGPPNDDPLFARADDLDAAGLTVEAGIELQRGESAFLSRHGHDRGLWVLLERYARFNGWRRAYQLAEVHGDAALASAPTGIARVFWTAAYPRAFRSLVDRFGRLERNPEFFVYAIMRKESAYMPTEVSYADARGLMQLLPQLGHRLARELRMPLSDEELYLPEKNIRLGARYTGALTRRFRGNLALAAGAYNAGAGAVTRWCARNGQRPLDEFVELVPYDDTREYMKRVLAIYARYHYLYKDRPLELSLNVSGCRPIRGGRTI